MCRNADVKWFYIQRDKTKKRGQEETRVRKTNQYEPLSIYL